MNIAVGQTVIHPHHGAVTIERRQSREINNTTLEFFVLGAEHGLSVLVPVDQAEEAGIRACMPKSRVRDIRKALQDPPTVAKGAWSRQLKRNQERYRSGDPVEVAALVRDLGVKEQKKGLSMAERRLFRDARRMLEGELAAVVKGGSEAAERLVDRGLATHLVEA